MKYIQRIHRSEITKEHWIDTSYIRTDGKEEFRERKEYGNRHIIFDEKSMWGLMHYDKINATDFPIGTIDHFSNYVEEKTGIPKILTNLVVASIVLYAGYRMLK